MKLVSSLTLSLFVGSTYLQFPYEIVLRENSGSSWKGLEYCAYLV